MTMTGEGVARSDAPPLLSVEDLTVTFATEDGTLTAVDEASLDVHAGEVVGIVGESGCGKSTLAQSLVRLHDERVTEYTGSVHFDGRDLLELTPEAMRRVRGNEIAMVFQDPLNSLNPVLSIGDQIIQVLRSHRRMSRRAARERAIELLEQTGINAPARRVRQYPHELSGGMRQRVVIALALAGEPRLLIADEPTTALDVTIQAQVLELLRDLGRQAGMTVLFITHDLGVVAEMCSRVVVMYLGQVIEEAVVAEIFERPLHPYTRGLLRSVPEMTTDRAKPLHAIAGTVPPLTQVPTGCRFVTRCPFAVDRCRDESPALRDFGAGHRVRCHRAHEIDAGRLSEHGAE